MANRTPGSAGLTVAPNGAGDVNNPAADDAEFQAHRFWNRWTTPAFLPNAASNAASSPAYDQMRPGDTAYVESTSSLHRLDDRGTNGGADAVWTDENTAQLDRFDANSVTFPATDPAGAVSRNEHILLTFDDTTAENAVRNTSVSRDYSGGDITFDIEVLSPATAPSPNDQVRFGVEVERSEVGVSDIDVDSFAAQITGDGTINAVSGISTLISITLTNAEADAIAAGENVRYRIARAVGIANNLAADAQVRGVIVRQ